ncbi:MAG: TonB family protein [Cyclonatronaceae bacterium]
METLLIDLSAIGKTVLQSIWVPVAVWTLLAGIATLVLRWLDGIHAAYHYQARLALILSLPAGTLFYLLLGPLTTLIAGAETTTSLLVLSLPVIADTGAGAVPGAVETTVLHPSEWIAAGVAFLFLAGLILLSGRFIWKLYQLASITRYAEIRPFQELDVLDEDSRELLQRSRFPVQIGFVQAPVVPVTFGSFRPLIVLPSELQKSPEKCNLAIRHEATHILHHDYLSHLLAEAVRVLYWFHPLVHLLKKELVEYRELRCDMSVLGSGNVSRKAYASLLLDLMPLSGNRPGLRVSMANQPSTLKKRIQMISKLKPSNAFPAVSASWLLGSMLLAMTLAMACTDMHSGNYIDEEELNIMTSIDYESKRGFHEIIIFANNEEQLDRHDDNLRQLRMLQPEHVRSIEVLRGNEAAELYGDRAAGGAIRITTKLEPDSYNRTVSVLGLETQDFTVERPNMDDVFVVTEQMPEIIGGIESIMQSIRYPEMARRAGIEGRVIVQFIVDEEGNAIYPQVVRGIGGGADEEALRVISQAKFRPGYQRGRPVKVQFSIPVVFRLQNQENSTQ